MVEKSRSQSTNARMQSVPCLLQTCARLTELRLPFDAAYVLHMWHDFSGATARVMATVSPIWSELITEPQFHISGSTPTPTGTPRCLESHRQMKIHFMCLPVMHIAYMTYIVCAINISVSMFLELLCIVVWM